MALKNDPKIQMIQEILQYRGFATESFENGIRVDLEEKKFIGAVVDFYVLTNNPEQIRSRIKRADTEGSPEENEIERIRQTLQDGLRGAANLNKFHSFGKRGNVRVYYAHLKMDKEPSAIIKQQKLAEIAFDQLNGIDPKTFRKGLDNIGLPRSSIVRLSLTRIFRDSMDIHELLHVTSQEADKIVNTGEWKAVRILKEGEQISFISNIIELLWEEVTKKYMKRAWDDLHS